jgi:hypothetical protein
MLITQRELYLFLGGSVNGVQKARSLTYWSSIKMADGKVPAENVFECDDEGVDYEYVDVVTQVTQEPELESSPTTTLHLGTPEPSDTSTVDLQADALVMDPKNKDLLWALTKPYDEMTDDELVAALKKVRELRTVRVGTMKKQSSLDVILKQLSPDKAASLIKQMEALLAKTTADQTEVGVNATEKPKEEVKQV